MTESPRPFASVAYLVVPAVTLTLAVGTLVSVATPRALVSVRLWGGPSVAGPQSLRLHCVRRAVGVEDGVPLAGLLVEIDGQPHPASCGRDGHGELPLDLPPSSAPRRIRVTHGVSELASGDVSVPVSVWKRQAIDFPADLAGGGSLLLRARLAGGVLALGQRGTVWLRAPDELRAAGALKVGANGADVKLLPARGDLLPISVLPTFLTATLEVEEAHPEPGKRPGAWEARLPVVAGAISVEGLSLKDGKLRGLLRSVNLKPAAFLRVHDQERRVAAASVPLSPDGQGGAVAPFEMSVPALQKPAWLVVASDIFAAGATALPWPIDPEVEQLDGQVVPDQRWLDGLAPALEREQARVTRKLWAVGGVVALGAILEALLLYERSREARRRLARHLSQFAEQEGMAQVEEHGGAGRVAVALLLVLFGFAVLGTLLVGRIG